MEKLVPIFAVIIVLTIFWQINNLQNQMLEILKIIKALLEMARDGNDEKSGIK